MPKSKRHSSNKQQHNNNNSNNDEDDIDIDNLIDFDTTKPDDHDSYRRMLDDFFAVDFIPSIRPEYIIKVSADREAKWRETFGLRRLKKFHDTVSRGPVKIAGFVAALRELQRQLAVAASSAKASQSIPGAGAPVVDRESLERIVSFVVVAMIDKCTPRGSGYKLASVFWRSKLPAQLWRIINMHSVEHHNATSHLNRSAAAANGNSRSRSNSTSTSAASSAGAGSWCYSKVLYNEVELALELLYLFFVISDITPTRMGSIKSAQWISSLMRLFSDYIRPTTTPYRDCGGVVITEPLRMRISHKSIMLLDVAWRLLIGDEIKAESLLLYDSDPVAPSTSSKSRAVATKKCGLARDALRHIRECVEKYPLMAEHVQETVDKLTLFVHPFDGHLTRTTQLPMFGPIRSRRWRRLKLRMKMMGEVNNDAARDANDANGDSTTNSSTDNKASEPSQSKNSKFSNRKLSNDNDSQKKKAIEKYKESLEEYKNSTRPSKLAFDAAKKLRSQTRDSSAFTGELARGVFEEIIGGFGSLPRRVTEPIARIDLLPPQLLANVDIKPWFAKPPRAAFDSIEAYVAAASLNRQERQYAEWWRRLIAERGMPLSLTTDNTNSNGMSIHDAGGLGNSFIINYNDNDNDGDDNDDDDDDDYEYSYCSNIQTDHLIGKNDIQTKSTRNATKDIDLDGQKIQNIATYEFCGIVEFEDLSALESFLDEKRTQEEKSGSNGSSYSNTKWPKNTEPRGDYLDCNAMYREIFPVLPKLCSNIMFAIGNWSPILREIPSYSFLLEVGPPQVSSITTLGIVKYPQRVERGPPGARSHDNNRKSINLKTNSAHEEDAIQDSASGSNEDNNSVNLSDTRSSVPLSGFNVKRLERPSSNLSQNQQNKKKSQVSLLSSRSSPGLSDLNGTNKKTNMKQIYDMMVGTRLIAQYAQWRAIGRLMLSMFLMLKSSHVLQAEYFALLLINEALIKTMFWWFERAETNICTRMASGVRIYSLSFVYDKTFPRNPEAQLTVGGDYYTSDSEHLGESDEFNRLSTSAGQPFSKPRNSRSNSSVNGNPKANHADYSNNQLDYWPSAVWGIYYCMRYIWEMSTHNGLRKGILCKNDAAKLYNDLMKVPCIPVRRVAADLYKDIVPIISKRHRISDLRGISNVFMYSSMPPGYPDTLAAPLTEAFWLSDISLDPSIELHRHVELLRLLHFYHYQVFELQLPKDPSLFPSLSSRTHDVPAVKLIGSGKSLGKVKADANKTSVKTVEEADNGWLHWDSELEDVLDDL